MNVNEKDLQEYFDKFIYKNKEEFSTFVQQSMLLPYVIGKENFKQHIRELNNQEIVTP